MEIETAELLKLLVGVPSEILEEIVPDNHSWYVQKKSEFHHYTTKYKGGFITVMFQKLNGSFVPAVIGKYSLADDNKTWEVC